MALSRLQAWLAGRPTLQKLASNSSWLLADQMLRVGAGALLNIWIARHFGPERLGAFNYGMAVVALWAPIAAFSLEVLLVRDLVRRPANAMEILASAFALRVGASLVSIFGAISMVAVARPGEGELVVLVLIAALAALLQSVSVIDCWFQSQVQAKYSALTRNIAFIAASLVKIAGVLSDAGVEILSCAVLVEAGVAAVLYQRIYRLREGKSLTLSMANWRQIRLYLYESRSLVLTGILIGVYMRVDRVIIGSLLGNRPVGIYSIAVQICELFYLLPTVVMASVYPFLVKLHADNEEKYRRRLVQVMAVFFYGGLLVALFFSLMADWLVPTLFGAGYRESAAIMKVYIYLLPLIGMSIVFSHWYVLHGKTLASMYGTVIGGASAIALNYWLIGEFGLIGSAYAALASMVLPTIVVSSFFERRVGKIFLDSIFLRFGRPHVT